MLDVIAILFSPTLSEVRLRLFEEFEERMVRTRDVSLTTIECAYFGRGFLLKDRPGIRRLQARAEAPLFHRDNLFNLALAQLPNSEAVAWVDGDLTFDDPNWAWRTLKALEDFEVVQPWSLCSDLGPYRMEIGRYRSFALWSLECPEDPIPDIPESVPYFDCFPGFSWAYRTDFLRWLGGLPGRLVTPTADHFMSAVLSGKIWQIPLEAHQKPILSLLHRKIWGDRDGWASRTSPIGCALGRIRHHWHGPRKSRGYYQYDLLMAKHDFDPEKDLVPNRDGVYELVSSKKELAREIQRLFENQEKSHPGDPEN